MLTAVSLSIYPARGAAGPAGTGAAEFEPRSVSNVPGPAPPSSAFRTVTAANSSPYTLDGTNTYLLGRGRAVVIDPGPDDPAHVGAVLDDIRGGGGAAALILVTHSHADHLGAAAALAAGTGAPVRRWEGGDRPLRDGEVVEADGIALRTLHTPGHAADHVVFHWAQQRVLFSGDLILGAGTVVLQARDGALEQYLASLERVAALDLALIAPGHGPLIADPRAKVAEYVAHRRMREGQVLEALAGGARTPGEIAGVIYRDLDPALHPAAENTVRAHLMKLVREGRARREGNRYHRP
jgi:glyoxylase-like metal-dependent hydrolase (beta-lactamase superfamily II)